MKEAKWRNGDRSDGFWERWRAAMRLVEDVADEVNG